MSGDQEESWGGIAKDIETFFETSAGSWYPEAQRDTQTS